MKYICEIDVAHEDGQTGDHLYCGRDCGWYVSKGTKKGGKTPYCNVFNQRLKLEKMPYELPAVLRCYDCRMAFYPVKEAEE